MLSQGSFIASAGSWSNCKTQHISQNPKKGISNDFLLFCWTANTSSSVSWPENKQRASITSGLCSMLFLLKYAIPTLWEACKGDCYLVFHIHDSGPSWGQSIDFLFFAVLTSGSSVCEMSFFPQLCWHVLSILEILRLSWYFQNRSVWSDAVWGNQTICHLLSRFSCMCYQSDKLSQLEPLPDIPKLISIVDDSLESLCGHNSCYFKLN